MFPFPSHKQVQEAARKDPILGFCNAKDKVYQQVIGHPKATGVVVGSLFAGLVLALNERKLQISEGCKEAVGNSAPGLLDVMARHGLWPYFAGTVAGAGAGTVAIVEKAEREGNRTKKLEAEFKKAVESSSKRSQKIADEARRLGLDINLGKEQAKEILRETARAESDAVKLATKAANLVVDVESASNAVDQVAQSLLQKGDQLNLLCTAIGQSRQNIKGFMETWARLQTAQVGVAVDTDLRLKELEQSAGEASAEVCRQGMLTGRLGTDQSKTLGNLAKAGEDLARLSESLAGLKTGDLGGTGGK